MASANGLINNNLVVNTLDGLTTVTTSGGTIDPALYVKYTGNTSNTDLNGYNLTTLGSLSGQILSIPKSAFDSEDWMMYTVSTNGNLSTLGGLIIQETTSGNAAYITGGVIGSKSFQFSTPGGVNAGKVVVTNADSVMSTTISAGQLSYITALTSQAGGVGQANTWSGAYNQFNGIVSTMGSNKFIQPYNATTLDISTLVNRATLDSAISGLGAGILTLNNTWSGTNTFNSTMTTGVGYTTSLNGALSTNLNDLGFTSASFTTSGITGAYSAPLGTITNVSGSTYQIAQTASGRSIMAISGFTPVVGTTYVFSFNIKCTIGTATIVVEQNNLIRSPQYYQLSTGFNRVVGTFYYDGTGNTIVFNIYTGTLSWNAQWDNFTLGTYYATANCNVSTIGTNRFIQPYNATALDVSTLVNRATMDATIASQSIVNLTNIFTGASNTFNNDVYLGTSTIVVNQQSITTSILQTSGISSQALGGTAVISGSYLLTPTPTTFAYASVYSPSQTFLANAKFNYLFTGFTAGIFGVSLTVYQANVANTGFVAISSTVPVVIGSFSGVFTPNSNSSYLGQVYFTFSGINSKTVGWTAFTYQRGMETVNGNLTVNGDTNTSTITASAITASGTITKNTSNPNSYMTIAGGNGFNSPVLESWFGSLRRGYIGNATASVFQLASENNCDFNLITGGSVRMTIDNAGITTIPSKELRVGNLASAANGQIRLSNGTTGSGYGTMLYNDSSGFYILLTNNNDANGNYNSLRPFNIDMASGRVYMSNNLTVRGGDYVFESIPQNTYLYAQVMCLEGNSLRRSQAVNKLVYFSNNVGWGGGVNTTYAFYLYNTTCSVQFWGKNSGYYSGGGMMQTTIRCYSQSAGTYYYFPINAFVNVGNNHFTVPLNYATTFPYTGWYDIYVYSTSGWITDGNDQLTIGVSILPVSGF